MKRNYKTSIVILLTLILFVGGFLHAEKILSYKWDNAEYVQSRKNLLMSLPQDSVDVLFLGASGIQYGFHPARLYEKTGIRSFNLGLPFQPPLAVYYNLQETLRRHKPKVVVIDFSFLDAYPDANNKKYVSRYQRSYTDFQSRILKKQYLQDVQNLSPGIDTLSFISQFYNYHTRWKNLTKNDFTGHGGYRKMLLGTRLWFQYEQLKMYDSSLNKQKEKTYEVDKRSEEVYGRLIQLCKEQGIAVVSVLPARNGTTLNQQNLFKEHAAENQLHYVDFNLPEVQRATGLDLSTDFRDAKHVNILGARKNTDYIGEYILEQNLLTPEAYPEADRLYKAWATEYAEIPLKMIDISDKK